MCDLDSQLTDTQQESQQSHLSEVSRLLALERNSHNFFEYVRMSFRHPPSLICFFWPRHFRYAKHLLAAKKAASIRLQDIAPPETSAPRVAAAAFYHCLGTYSFSTARPEAFINADYPSTCYQILN